MSYHEFVMENLEQILFLSVLMGGLAGFTAKRKGKDPFFWFFVGALFGMLGVFFILFAPTRKKKLAYVGGEVRKEQAPLPLLSPPSYTSFETREWFYLTESEEQKGPYSFDALRQAWHTAAIGANTLVWNETLENWKEVHTIQGLEDALLGFPEE